MRSKWRWAALAVVAVLGITTFIAAAPASANRPNPQRAKISRLVHQNRVLRHRLANMTLDRNRVRASLATAQSQIMAFQGQLASTQATLTQRTLQRDAALAQAASLRAQITAIPTPLAVAIEQVRREVVWAGAAFPKGQLVATSAMNYVEGHVSTGAFGYLVMNSLPVPIWQVNAVLGAQAGICGTQVRVFAAIVTRLGYPVRSVEFYWTLTDGTPDNHIAAEVYYDGGWHYFDSTFGAYWADGSGNILSVTDARAGLGTERKDVSSFTNLIEDGWFGGDDTSFMTDPATTVILGGRALDW